MLPTLHPPRVRDSPRQVAIREEGPKRPGIHPEGFGGSFQTSSGSAPGVGRRLFRLEV